MTARWRRFGEKVLPSRSLSVAIIGGARVSDQDPDRWKPGKTTDVLSGGGMAYAFMEAQGGISSFLRMIAWMQYRPGEKQKQKVFVFTCLPILSLQISLIPMRKHASLPATIPMDGWARILAQITPDSYAMWLKIQNYFVEWLIRCVWNGKFQHEQTLQLVAEA